MIPILSFEDILLRLEERPPRIVSLVPSYTESLFDLGFGRWVIGVTDYCLHPVEGLTGIARVGGVRNTRVDQIVALSPDLVIANQEENSPETVYGLEQAGIPVWLTFPRTVQEMFDVLGGMVRLYHDESASLRVRMLETGFDWAVQAAPEVKARFFCPIWMQQDEGQPAWYMTANRHTYLSDLLEQLGGENIFADRSRRYPLEADLNQRIAEDSADRDTRYPRVTVEEVLAAQPEVIFLPDEPFPFGAESVNATKDLLANTPAVQSGRVYRLDGSLLTWYGTRIGLALDEIPQYLSI